MLTFWTILPQIHFAVIIYHMCQIKRSWGHWLFVTGHYLTFTAHFNKYYSIECQISSDKYEEDICSSCDNFCIVNLVWCDGLILLHLMVIFDR